MKSPSVIVQYASIRAEQLLCDGTDGEEKLLPDTIEDTVSGSSYAIIDNDQGTPNLSWVSSPVLLYQGK